MTQEEKAFLVRLCDAAVNVCRLLNGGSRLCSDALTRSYQEQLVKVINEARDKLRCQSDSTGHCQLLDGHSGPHQMYF